jgi:transcriptional regulator with XRE-family HTH domain
MKIQDARTDEAALAELGRRIAGRRIALRLNQAELAERSGVGKRTIERIEAGESCQLTSWLRVLRVLELLPALDAMIEEERPRPMELLRHGKKQPRRVRKRADEQGQVNEDSEAWKWGDES